MQRQYREVSFIKRLGGDEEPFEADTVLTFEADGTAYRRIHSRTSEEFYDVAVTGSAIDYERRLLEVKQQMAEADELARNTAKAR